MVAFASSLDQAGPLARTVRDAAIMLRSMAGPDAKDSTCSPAPVPDYEAAVGRSVKGMKIGVPKEYRLEGMNSEIEALWTRGAEWLRAAGASVVEVSLPHTPYALPAYYIVAPAEASSNLARYDGVRYGLRVDADDDRGARRLARLALLELVGAHRGVRRADGRAHRLQALAPPEWHAQIYRLTEDQLIGLRFASDDEVVALAKEALEQNLTRKQIKERIKSWRPDTWRV